MADTTRAPEREGERRLPMALAVLAAAGFDLMVPADFSIGTWSRIAYPVVLLLLLGLLVVGDPGRIDRERPWLRVTTGLMIGLITLSTAASAVRLVVGLLDKADFDSAAQLLSLGAAVWCTNVIAFALWYWHLDSGGPVARAHGTGGVPAAFHFPEHSLEPLVEAGWYPQFVDYLALSFNTATAFSPTDVSAIRHWSKLWLIAESAISLVLAGLVIARAVNIL
ncbi:MAG: hypothetical protein H6529_05465 [Nocardioides sp.]|nr:hypothetical protein [Nocardioides sp.]